MERHSRKKYTVKKPKRYDKNTRCTCFPNVYQGKNVLSCEHTIPVRGIWETHHNGTLYTGKTTKVMLIIAIN